MLQVKDKNTRQVIAEPRFTIVDDRVQGQVILLLHDVDDAGDDTPAQWHGVPVLWNGRPSKLVNAVDYRPDGRGMASVRLQIYF